MARMMRSQVREFRGDSSGDEEGRRNIWSSLNDQEFYEFDQRARDDRLTIASVFAALARGYARGLISIPDSVRVEAPRPSKKVG